MTGRSFNRTTPTGGAGRPRSRVDAADRRLLAIVDASVAEAGGRGGAWIACGPGCSDCCVGPFPITALDARRLRAGLRALEERDPDRAAALVRRARASAEAIQADFPGDPVSGRLGADDAAADRFCERHAAEPCPALDPATHRCDLYDHRPVSCRTYGPPVRIGAEALPPCPLCFQGAPASVVDTCRVEIDPDDAEGAALDALAAAGGETGETLVAHALREPRRP
jgi:Fe-S-cluster containining protein